MFSDHIDITSQDRVKYGSRYYDVLFVGNESEMDHHLEIFLKEYPNSEIV